jgi:CheY-like chemotaxis protein
MQRESHVMKHRVLVVDDYPDAAESACTLLTLLGHECHFVMTGQAAIYEALAFQPDVAILDIGLPDVSGFDVARELRKQFESKPLYLVAMTGWGQPNDRARAYAAGFDLHVLKPADRTKLTEILDHAERASGFDSHPA